VSTLLAQRRWSRNQVTVALVAGTPNSNRQIRSSATGTRKQYRNTCSIPIVSGFEQPEVAPILRSAQRTRFQLRRPSERETGVCCKPELRYPHELRRDVPRNRGMRIDVHEGL
jgi:hypothetical protein